MPVAGAEGCSMPGDARAPASTQQCSGLGGVLRTPGTFSAFTQLQKTTQKMRKYSQQIKRLMCEWKRGSLWLGCAVPGGCVVISGRPNSPARENSLGHTKLSQSLRGNPCCASMALGSPVLRFSPPHTHPLGHDPCGFCL